ncbi:MAG: response regulator [Gammaproteobacteria bacterium]|jgi:CheY-like chemotaxis protein|nr:response regulator [Gammaproteobacteria bacterium]
MPLLISPLFHPTTTILIDDNEAFLEGLGVALNDDAIYHTFSNPTQALAYCTENAKIRPIDDSYLMADTESPDSSQQNITLHTKEIKTALLKPERFDVISVIVVDFSMPQLTGVEFIDQLREQVKNKFAKIIMVTGEADHGLAVQLFNDKKIDKFFLKSEDNLEGKINAAINEMQEAYFLDLCKTLFSSIIAKTTPILNDAAFADLFAKIKADLNIVEHYLCENTGSFVLVNRDGAMTVLVVRTKEDLMMYADLAADQRVPTELVNRILNGSLLPFFGTFEKFIGSKRDDWVENTHLGKKVPGREGYYYSVIESRKVPTLPGAEHIASFANYIEAVNA